VKAKGEGQTKVAAPAFACTLFPSTSEINTKGLHWNIRKWPANCRFAHRTKGIVKATQSKLLCATEDCTTRPLDLPLSWSQAGRSVGPDPQKRKDTKTVPENSAAHVQPEMTPRGQESKEKLVPFHGIVASPPNNGTELPELIQQNKQKQQNARTKC